MKKDSIIDFLGFTAVRILSVLFWCIPLQPALWIGRRIGDLAYFSNTKRRMIAYANLKSAFPLKDSAELKRINRKHFENLGMSVIELLRMPIMGRRYLNRYVELRNFERIKQGLSKGKGVILFTGHFGNWEVSSLAINADGYKVSVFAREQKYTRLNNLLNKYRESTGAKVITKGFSARDIIRTLNNNGIVGMLVDQDAGIKGIFVDFLNRPASMAKGPIVFALRTGAVVLPVFIWRVKNIKHIIQVGEPLEMVNTGDEDADLKNNSQRISNILAGYVNIFPEQWLWSHKRWKSTPQRNVLVLSDGKPGHFNQSMAVAEMIKEVQGAVKIDTVEVKFKNRLARMLLDIASLFAGPRCQGCLRCMRFCLKKESFEKIKSKYADVVISCGAGTVGPNIFLRYENNAKNIGIMKQGLGRDGKFNLVILPKHDVLSNRVGLKIFNLRGWTRSNVLITEAAPNRITDTLMAEALTSIPSTLLASVPSALPPSTSARGGTGQHPASSIHGYGLGLLIGGDAKNFKLERAVVEKVIDGILKLSEEMNLDIFVSSSRRTSKEIDELLKQRLNNNSHCKLLIIANEKNIEGGVPAIFGMSDIIITSPDSISMISEALTSGKYVIVFKTKERMTKYGRMILTLEKEGYIKTAESDNVYSVIKEVLTLMPEVKRLNDRERIVKRIEQIA